jgi:hypothetical protein
LAQTSTVARTALLTVASALGCTIASIASAADAPSATAPPVTAIHCGHLLDVLTGKMLGPTTVIVEGKRVREVADGSKSLAGATEIDLSSQTCLPGLIDSHTHLSSQSSPTQYSDEFHWNLADYVVRATIYARRTLLAGFTTVRNLGDQQNETVALRNAISSPDPASSRRASPSAPRAATPTRPMAIGMTLPVIPARTMASSTVSRTPQRQCVCTTSAATT